MTLFGRSREWSTSGAFLVTFLEFTFFLGRSSRESQRRSTLPGQTCRASICSHFSSRLGSDKVSNINSGLPINSIGFSRLLLHQVVTFSLIRLSLGKAVNWDPLLESFGCCIRSGFLVNWLALGKWANWDPSFLKCCRIRSGFLLKMSSPWQSSLFFLLPSYLFEFEL